jgi:hypothetical protein
MRPNGPPSSEPHYRWLAGVVALAFGLPGGTLLVYLGSRKITERSGHHPLLIQVAGAFILVAGCSMLLGVAITLWMMWKMRRPKNGRLR